MNTENVIDDALPMTRGQFVEFCNELCAGLAPRKTGDIALPHEIIGLHSDSPVEYDQTIRVRLFDLVGDRTGVERDDGRVYFAD